MQKKDKNNNSERPTTRKEKLAGFLYDIAKLIFTAMVLGAFSPIISNDIESVNLWMVAGGLITTVIFAVSANHLLK